ncbi:MAG: Hsp70 family protein [Oscillatoriales cyanobacterium SM2_2_1]|nr:Hsp70 family protein [Oscillatoriales cyanobacterium SM2_2_1]
MHYAIDFGTSNTVVARLSASGQPESVALPGLSAPLSASGVLIPSCLYVVDGATAQVWCGQEVGDRGLENDPSRCFRGFKRGLGGPLVGFVPELDGVAVPAERLGSWFLQRIWASLQQQAPAMSALTLTVPVDSFELYRQWLLTVTEGQNLPVQLVDEPTAAALGYGITEGRALVLICDLGGGTADFSLVRLEIPRRSPLQTLLRRQGVLKPTAQVLSKAGLVLGGIDIDQWILEFWQQHLGVPRNSLTLRLAERVKIALSSAEEANEFYFDDRTLQGYELTLGRSQLVDILTQRHFFQRLERGLHEVEQQALRQNLTWQDLDGVVLLGGTMLMPAVRDWLADHFASQKLYGDRPLEAIAHGAVQLPQWHLTDILYHSYGVRYWDKKYQRHHWHPLIPAGQVYPLTQPIELVLGASAPDQPAIELVIGELSEQELEVYWEENLVMTRPLSQQNWNGQPLNANQPAIAQLNPLGQPGSDRLRVTLTIDANRTLRLTVTDLLTQQTLTQDRPVARLQ